MCDVSYITLFDMDGVILRNKNIHNRVAQRSIEFLQKKLPKIDNCSVDQKTLLYINSVAYKNLGHSCLLLGDDKEVIDDYNKFVFDQNLMNFIHSSIDKTDQYCFNNIARGVEKASIDTIGLFTNTPLRYCESVLYSMSDKTSFADRLLSLAFTSDEGFLKPLSVTYDQVEKKLGDFTEIHFLDDSPKNLAPVDSRQHWYTRLIESEYDIIKYLEPGIGYKKKQDMNLFINPGAGI